MRIKTFLSFHGIEEPMCRVYHTEFNSGIGKIFIASTEKGVCRISLLNAEQFFQWLSKHFDNVKENESMNADAIIELNEYFKGELRAFSVKVDLKGTEFQKRVWREVKKIPFGKTCSYKEIARRVGNVRVVRAVGSANKSNPIPIIIPCHRVIASNGELGGFTPDIELKKRLLRLEGIKI